MKRSFWWFRIGLPLHSLLLLAAGSGLGSYGLLYCGSFPAGLLVARLWVALPSMPGELLLVILAVAVVAQWWLIGYGIDRLVERRLRTDPRRCPQCGYDICGLPAPRCPECGGAITLLDPRDNDLGKPP